MTYLIWFNHIFHAVKTLEIYKKLSFFSFFFTGHQGQHAASGLLLDLSLCFTPLHSVWRAPPQVTSDQLTCIELINSFINTPVISARALLLLTWPVCFHDEQKEDGEWGPAHAQRRGAQAGEGAAELAPDEAAGRQQRQQRGDDPDEEEAEPGGAVRPERHDTGGDPVRFGPLRFGVTAGVISRHFQHLKRNVISIFLFCSSFTRMYFYLFYILFMKLIFYRGRGLLYFLFYFIWTGGVLNHS